MDSERQAPGADLGGAGYGEHGGADNRPPGRAGLHSVTGAGQVLDGDARDSEEREMRGWATCVSASERPGI